MDLALMVDKISRIIDRSDGTILELSLRRALILLNYHFSNKRMFEWSRDNIHKSICVVTPTQFKGIGTIRLGKNVVFGVVRSPGSMETSYIEARHQASIISFGDDTTINNCAKIVSDGASIALGCRNLIGDGLRITDSNSHMLPISRRAERDDSPKPVNIGDDVFIGSGVTILKGVTVGDGCIIATGAILFPGFVAPPSSIILGNPAQVVGQVPI